MTGPAPHRVGEPSPLMFHLAAALSAYGQALLAAPRADAADFPWSPHLRAEAAALGPDVDRVAVAAEIAARLRETVRGIEAWQAHPYRRAVVDPPVVWTQGSSRLLDYGQAPEAADPSGPPVLVLPSLINRAYVLDLEPDRSMMRFLAAKGLRPLLLDWGAPGPAESGFSLDDYGRLRLLPALAAARALAGRPVGAMGYCMGGALAAGLAARNPDGLVALATIGAPWDFAAASGIAGGLRAMARAAGPEKVGALVDQLGEVFGAVPVHAFQALFAFVNPIQAALKFRKFARLDPEGAEARRFVALEDWLADGVPMAAPTARTLLVDWQIRNRTAAREWRFLGGAVEPGAIRLPTLSFCGRSDSIAPPGLALALPAAIPGSRTVRPATGHVGMIVGGSAEAEVWRPLAAFLHAHAG